MNTEYHHSSQHTFESTIRFIELKRGMCPFLFGHATSLALGGVCEGELVMLGQGRFGHIAW